MVTRTGIEPMAKCLLCGCCLEVCPNFDPNSEFAGAVLPVNAYRILNEEQDIAHQTELANAYQERNGRFPHCVGMRLHDTQVRCLCHADQWSASSCLFRFSAGL